MEEARILVEKADLHIRVIDAADRMDGELDSLDEPSSAEGRLEDRGIGAIHIFNKIDLLDREELTLRLPNLLSDCTNSLGLSSLREQGFPKLFEKLLYPTPHGMYQLIVEYRLRFLDRPGSRLASPAALAKVDIVS